MQRVLKVLMALGVMLGSVGWAAPAGATHMPTLLAEDGVAPVTDGVWAVWASSLYTEPFSDLFATQLSSGETIPVTDGLVPLGGYDLERTAVVWSAPEDECQNLPTEACDLNIYARVLPSDHVYDVATTDEVEEDPVISETLVVWNAWDGERRHIRARNIGEAPAPEPFTIYSENPSDVPEPYMPPVVSRPFVAWATYWEDANADQTFGWSLWVHNLDTDGPPQAVAEGLGLLTDFDLDGTVLVYSSDETGVVARDLLTQEATTVSTPALDVVTDGRYIVWTAGTGAGGDASDGTDIWMHDLATSATFAVADGNRFALAPHLANDWLVWEHGGLPFPDDEYPHQPVRGRGCQQHEPGADGRAPAGNGDRPELPDHRHRGADGQQPALPVHDANAGPFRAGLPREG